MRSGSRPSLACLPACLYAQCCCLYARVCMLLRVSCILCPCPPAPVCPPTRVNEWLLASLSQVIDSAPLAAVPSANANQIDQRPASYGSHPHAIPHTLAERQTELRCIHASTTTALNCTQLTHLAEVTHTASDPNLRLCLPPALRSPPLFPAEAVAAAALPFCLPCLRHPAFSQPVTQSRPLPAPAPPSLT